LIALGVVGLAGVVAAIPLKETLHLPLLDKIDEDNVLLLVIYRQMVVLEGKRYQIFPIFSIKNPMMLPPVTEMAKSQSKLDSAYQEPIRPDI
jgi:hypothetical protein